MRSWSGVTSDSKLASAAAYRSISVQPLKGTSTSKSFAGANLTGTKHVNTQAPLYSASFDHPLRRVRLAGGEQIGSFYTPPWRSAGWRLTPIRRPNAPSVSPSEPIAKFSSIRMLFCSLDLSHRGCWGFWLLSHRKTERDQRWEFRSTLAGLVVQEWFFAPLELSTCHWAHAKVTGKYVQHPSRLNLVKWEVIISTTKRELRCLKAAMSVW